MMRILPKRVGLPSDWTRAMREKLRRNAHKGTRKNWTADPPRQLMRRVREEVAELQQAMSFRLTPEQVYEEAADVANMAFMVADAYARQEGGTDAS